MNQDSPTKNIRTKAKKVYKKPVMANLGKVTEMTAGGSYGASEWHDNPHGGHCDGGKKKVCPRP